MAEARLPASTLADGAMISVQVGNAEVVVAKVGGRCFALGGECTHDGAPMVDGELGETTLTCPWHGTIFELATGNVVDGLAEEPLPVYAVAIDGDEIVVTERS